MDTNLTTHELTESDMALMDNVVMNGHVDQCNSPRATDTFLFLHDGFGALEPINDDDELIFL